MTSKKVLVSGCFDLLHGGHIAFFKTASSYGNLYVSIGKDENLLLLKGKKPVFSEDERLYIVKSIRYVYDAFLASGTGMLDFLPDAVRIKPDIFVVNRMGILRIKRLFVKRLEYSILYWTGFRNPDYLSAQVLPLRGKCGFLTAYALPEAGWISPGYPKFTPDQQ